MPPFVFSANPPALIQPVAPDTISDRTHLAQTLPTTQAEEIEGVEIEVVEPPSSEAEVPISSSENENDSQENLSSSDPDETVADESNEEITDESTEIPSVIEVYYDSPQKIPPSNETNPSATDTSADELGESISVGSDRPPATPPESEPPASPQTPIAPVAANQSPEASVEKTLVGGLNLLGNAQKARSAKVVVKTKKTGETKEFTLSLSPDGEVLAQDPPPTTTPEEPTGVVEVISDRQEYNEQEQVVTARGNVEVRFPNGVLLADRVQVNLPNRLAVAEGQVILNRGNQVLRGDRFEYYFVQDSGVVFNANGEIYQPTIGSDLSPTLPDASNTVPTQTLSDRLALTQPLQRITTAEGYRFVVGGVRDLSLASETGDALPTTASGGQINRVRFQADRIDFEGSTWEATNVRLTNDPFSPPELEVRADRATFRQLEPLVDEVALSNSRIVFDQWLSLPTFQNRILLDRRDRRPGLFSIAYDGNDRGGLYIERSFNLIDTPAVSLQVTPQYLIQKSLFPNASIVSDQDQDEEVEDESGLDSSVFGLTSKLEVNFSPTTTLRATANLPSLDVSDFEDNARAQVRLQQKVGNLQNPYLLNLEYNYRERLFNGTLGFQTVNSSIGALVTSPSIPIGQTGVVLNYQGSVQSIVAATDRLELLEPDREDNLVTLTRFQGAASLSRSFILWAGEPLPPTAEEGLRYTPTPVLPFLILSTQVTGVASFYSSGDSQPVLTGTIGLLGQIGHFSRPFFDYTGFNVIYSQAVIGDQSPFFFDRVNDTKILSWGITQQVYGPIRVGFQQAINVDTNEEISTDYFVEYSRRTYNILLRYNPVLEVGSINLRISDFNWNGNPGAFEGTGIRPVVGGVTR